MQMTFPFVIQGRVKSQATHSTNVQAVLEKLAEAVKREGGSEIAIIGDTLDFAGVSGQLSISPLANIDRSSVTISCEPGFICLRYVARPDKWAAYVAVIMMLVGMTAWLLAVFPLQFPAGAGLAMLIIWVAYIATLQLRYESFLRRSITHGNLIFETDGRRSLDV
jgi:hypothetical protein